MGTGEGRALDAASRAVESPLLETSVDGAQSILLSITGGPDLSLWEVNEAAKAVSEAAHPDANIIFGAMVDEKLGDEVWITVVATGYEPVAAAAPRAPAVGLRRRRRAARDAHRAPTPQPARPAARRADSLDIDVPEFLAPLGSTPMRGVVAAGHPLTAEAGADVLRAGGNAVDAAVAAVLMSFAAESPLTGPGRGRVHARPHRGGREPPARLLRRRARARARATRSRRRWSRSTSRSPRARSSASTSGRRRAGCGARRAGWRRRSRASAPSRWAT